MTRLDRISESHSRALREAPYTEAHNNSYTLKMQRTTPPRLRELVRDLRRAYSDEVPSRIHSRDTDGGGDPAWSPEFTRFLTGSDFGTDERTPGRCVRGRTGCSEHGGTIFIDDRCDSAPERAIIEGNYTTPFRACLTAMRQSAHEGTRRRASIVFRVVVAGNDPVEAAMIEGAPEWDASACSRRALELFWTRLSDIRLDLRKTETAA